MERPTHFDDFVRAPNISSNPDLYELENAAIRRNGRLDAALRSVRDWTECTPLDIGCGTGFWLPEYVGARRVVGIEPDPELLELAQHRVADLGSAEVLSGSAEHLPVADDSIEVVHARFAHFFGEGGEKGLAEVRRVLAPGGTFVAVDNDWSWGDFADLLGAATTGNASLDPQATRRWWHDQGAERVDVRAGWDAESPEQIERLLRLEFSDDVVDGFLRHRPPASSITYGMSLYVIRV